MARFVFVIAHPVCLEGCCTSPSTVLSAPSLFCVQLTNCYIRAGKEMWISDGTSAGTVRVGDIDAGVSSSDPSYFARLDASTLLFAAYSTPFGRELWRTDGTRTGTKMVTDLYIGIQSSNPT